MPDPFRLLRILSVVFKVLAFVFLILVLIAVVGILVAPAEVGTPPRLPMIMNMVFSGLLAFLTLFTLGEIIRLLLVIEAQTKKE